MKRKLYFPDGRAYCCLLFVVFVLLVLSILLIRIDNHDKALECVKVLSMLQGLIIVRSIFPEALCVQVGRYALFYFTMDRVFAIRIRSCNELFECVQICPVTTFAVKIFSHIRGSESECHTWIRKLFWQMLFLSWLVAVFVWVANLLARKSSVTVVDIIFPTGFLLSIEFLIYVARCYLRNLVVKFCCYRRLVRVPDDEIERKKLFKRTFRCAKYSAYTDRKVLPSMQNHCHA